MILSLWGNAAFAEKAVKVYVDNAYGLNIKYMGSTVNSVCQAVFTEIKERYNPEDWTILYASSESHASQKAHEYDFNAGGFGKCYANFRYKDELYFTTDTFGEFSYRFYCPSKHGVPKNTDEFSSFDYAEKWEIDANGDCLEYCPVPMLSTRQSSKQPQCNDSLTIYSAPGEVAPTPKGAEGYVQGPKGPMLVNKSTYDLITKLVVNNIPQPNIPLTFEVKVEDGSGNHPKKPPNRPNGKLNITGSTNLGKDKIKGTTDANGEVKITFTAPIFSGTHTITVKCEQCSENAKRTEKTFDVKVGGLMQVPPNKDWRFISTDEYHKNNNASTATQTVYYLNAGAYASLYQLTAYMVKEGWKDKDRTNPNNQFASVGLNDASLKWGGKFYSYKSGTNYIDWTSNDRAHKEHRIGAQIDLRTSDLVDSKLKEQMYNKICNPKDKKYPVQARILWHTGKVQCKNKEGKLVSCTPEHYHAYLLGDGVDKKLGGGACSIKPN